MTEPGPGKSYQKPNDLPPETLTIDRAKIVWMTGAFYVVAFRPDYMAREPGLPAWKYLREYRLDRILAVDVLDMPVACASLPAMRCVFLLGPELRERVLDLRDADGRSVQSVETLADGCIRVTLEEISLIRARQRLLLFGEHLLAVEEPPELRDEIVRSVAALAARFSPPEEGRDS